MSSEERFSCSNDCGRTVGGKLTLFLAVIKVWHHLDIQWLALFMSNCKYSTLGCTFAFHAEYPPPPPHTHNIWPVFFCIPHWTPTHNIRPATAPHYGHSHWTWLIYLQQLSWIHGWCPPTHLYTCARKRGSGLVDDWQTNVTQNEVTSAFTSNMLTWRQHVSLCKLQYSMSLSHAFWNIRG